MKRVVVSVSNNLSTDQRVAKVCDSLQKNGFDIVLIGRNYPKSKKLLRTYKVKRFSLLFNKGVLFYAAFNIRLFFYLLFHKKDILLSNDVDTLLPNFLISKLQRKTLVFDSHELFSEIPELVHRKRVKQVWLSIERHIIPKLSHCYTVCQSIAAYYKETYGTNFMVVRNYPLSKQLKSTVIHQQEKRKIIIYQGAVNVGRGLELMIDAMHFLEEYVLWIIGDGDIYSDLKQKVKAQGLTGKVLFHGRILPMELQNMTPKAALGISLEEDLGLNYRYALPNKIFDYIQAEVPILISDLPEMRKIVDDHQVGEVILRRKADILAEQIKRMSTKDFSKELKEAKEQLIWNTEETKLIQLFKSL